MRIAILATRHSEYSVEAATALARQADTLLIIARNALLANSDVGRREALARNGQLVTFGQRFPLSMVARLKISRALARFRPDAVILHQDGSALVASVLGTITRLAPVFLVVHDVVAHPGSDEDIPAARLRRIFRERDVAKVLLAHGDHCTGLLARWEGLGDQAIVSVPHGPVMRPAFVQPSPNPRRVLMFGRMEAYKGLDLLLAATRRLQADGGRIELRLAGQGPDLARLRAEFESLGCCTIRDEFVPRPKVLEEIRDAAVIVAPYTEASQSGVVAAAFANGRPVVATAVGGLPDVVRHGKNGLLVPPGDAEALADALRAVTEKPALLAELSAGARETAETTISWDRFATTVVDLAAHGATASVRPRRLATAR